MVQLGMDFPTKWARGYVARFVRSLLLNYYVSPVTKRMATLEVRGIENVRGASPYIFVANHASNLDTPLVLTALPRTLRNHTGVAAAMDSFFLDAYRAFRTVILFNAIPIDRHRVNRRSAQQALELVEDHWTLLIFPEGGRTPDGTMHEFKGGAAYLADRAKATVIPTYIHESGHLRGPKYAKAPIFVNTPNQRRHHVIVAFAPALYLREGESLRRLGVRIQEAVAELGREVSGDPDYGIMPISEA